MKRIDFMKKFTRIIAMCLVLITVLSIPSFALEAKPGPDTVTVTEDLMAAIDAENPESPGDTNEDIDVVVPEDPEIPETPSDSTLNFNDIAGDTVVGRMYICTQQVGLGHAWIYIESNFNGDMQVGCYTLKPYQGVSMGCFCFSRSDGPGLYYNIESYCGNKYGLKNESSLGMDITKDQLIKVSKRIKQWNYWDFYFNCTFFAAEIWNCASKKKIIPLMFPALEKMQILILGGSREVNMKDVEKTDCYKQKGVGSNARLVQASEKSLDSKLM